MPRLCTLAALLAALVLTSCGGDDEPRAGTQESAGTPAAQACPPNVDRALADAEARMAEDDFDGAFAVLQPLRGCPRVADRFEQYRPRAARITLRVARDRLREAEGRDDSPQPAVSIARNSIKYFPTPEAREFLASSERKLAAFKRENGDKPDEEPGGPPSGAGEGGPPDKAR